MRLTIVLGLALLVFGSGCASMMGSKEQSISVETVLQGDRLDDAKCRLNNSEGTWFVKTPGSTTVHKSTSDMNVKCEKAPHRPGMAVVKSSVNGSMFGNILFGGIIGAAVDAGTGAGFNYPSLITVEMGETAPATKIPPPQQGQTVEKGEIGLLTN